MSVCCSNGSAFFVTCVQLVCKAWKKVLDDDLVWRERFKRRWGLKEVRGSPAKKSFYQNASESTFVRKVRVESSDSIASIALRTGTSVSLLKQVNNLVSDSSLYCRSDIYIPVAEREDVSGASVSIQHCKHTLREYGFVCVEGEGQGEDDGAELPMAQTKRKQSDNGKQAELLLSLMARSLKIDESSARFYLETSDYDLKAAMENYKADDQWEHEQGLLLKSKTKKSREREAPTTPSFNFCCY